MRRPLPGSPLVALFWRLYVLLGVASVAAGIFLIKSPQAILSGANADLTPLRIIGCIFLVFGIVRIGNAGIQLWRLKRP